MIERRVSTLLAGLVVFFISMALWRAFAPSRPAAPTSAAPSSTAVAVGDTATVPVTAASPPSAPALDVSQQPAPAPAPAGPTYMELLARSATRRRIRLSAGSTYLNDVVAASEDSMLHRWDNRVQRPVRVFLGPATAANFQPSFLNAVRAAFARWEQAGVPVRFDLDADSASAEVMFRWKIQFEIERTGQTDLTWDQDGHLVSGTVTLATFDPKGQPLGPEEVRVVALHEVGHLIGLDHSSDSTDVMYAATRVRDLSPRDIASALLLYELTPGSLR
jgi:hypothetical protein